MITNPTRPPKRGNSKQGPVAGGVEPTALDVSVVACTAHMRDAMGVSPPDRVFFAVAGVSYRCRS